MPTPAFPPPFVIERTAALGYGSGPWTREQLVQTWNAPVADKYIAEAKAAGWLVSPSRGTYYVPPARDIMLVPWLSEPARLEYLISRTLAAADIRAWCLSAWCREQGVLLPEPVFVTDLSRVTEPPRKDYDRQVLAQAARSAALRNVPFLENLLIVPAMPQLEPAQRKIALVPESPEATTKRRNETAIGQAALGIVGLIALAMEKPIDEIGTQMQKLESREADARGISYYVDGTMTDTRWIAALLAAIGTSRIEELVTTKLKPQLRGEAQAVQWWSALLGPPQPVSAWKETLGGGMFPYLLVPPALWSEMGADQAARRYRMLEQLAKP